MHVLSMSKHVSTAVRSRLSAPSRLSPARTPARRAAPTRRASARPAPTRIARRRASIDRWISVAPCCTVSPIVTRLRTQKVFERNDVPGGIDTSGRTVLERQKPLPRADLDQPVGDHGIAEQQRQHFGARGVEVDRGVAGQRGDQRLEPRAAFRRRARRSARAQVGERPAQPHLLDRLQRGVAVDARRRRRSARTRSPPRRCPIAAG